MLGTLLVVYLVSAAAALRNPLHLPDHLRAISMQTATLITLGIMTPLLVDKPVEAVLIVLAASFVLRLIILLAHIDNDASWIVRWDTFAMIGGLLTTIGLIAHDLAGAPLAVLLVGIGVPLLTALPRASNAMATHAALLQASLDVSTKAYKVRRDDVTPDSEYVQDTKTGTLAGVTTIEDSGNVFIFFAGTQSWTDWVRVNADVSLTSLPSDWTSSTSKKAKVHRGFLTAYLSIRAQLWPRIQDLILRVGGAAKIVVCGHSLGGALATIAAVDLAARLDPEDAKKLACVTFGSPNVGDLIFVNAFNATVPLSLRVAAVYDPVPKVFSSQLPHVDTLVPIASPPILPYTHSIKAYRWGIQQRPLTNVLAMAAPMLSVLGATVLFSTIAPRLR